MKTLLRVLALVSLLLLPKLASAQEEIDFQYFYDELAPYGQWTEVEGYGYCWQPDIRDSDWQPYSFGHWASTDDGWLWVSDDSEPWGWIVYHYGRWINFEDRGWFWVPGYTWAPAWVTWRSGDEYCGWAPLPPAIYTGEIGFGWYNFCPVRYIGEPSLRRCIVKRTYNYTFINRTVVIVGGRAHSRGRYYTQGPSVVEINRRADHPVRHYQVNRRTDVSRSGAEHFRPRENGNSMTVYAPTVRREKRNTAAAPSTVAVPVATTPVVNNGNNAYRPPRVSPTTPPSVEPNRWINRAAVSSVYKHEPTPPTPRVSTPQPQQQIAPVSQPIEQRPARMHTPRPEPSAATMPAREPQRHREPSTPATPRPQPQPQQRSERPAASEPQPRPNTPAFTPAPVQGNPGGGGGGHHGESHQRR